MAVKVHLPNGGWRPRPYQRAAWDYLRKGGRHAELIWHRRSGKDEICLHRAAIAAIERPATYWHMLPKANQARKAIWDAVNPHTGKRRIDEAFPHELRSATRENEMLIKFVNGATWQVVGSDNFDALVGSPPAGITYSEWALARPESRAILRPILAENHGWQLFITTPRGKNHAYDTFRSAQKEPDAFAQVLTVHDTAALDEYAIADELLRYIADFGEDMGSSLFRQEYLCDWSAAVLGAFFGKEMASAQDEGRLCEVAWQPEFAVHTAWDLGRSDDTVIWFYQRAKGEIHLIDYFEGSGFDVPDLASAVLDKPYKYGTHWFPHDARMKVLAANGRSIIEQMHTLGVKGQIVPEIGVQDGIQAARAMLPVCWFDAERCDRGIEHLRQYSREWDADRSMFRQKPEHDAHSHAADAFRMLAVAWREENPRERAAGALRSVENATLNEILRMRRTRPAMLA